MLFVLKWKETSSFIKIPSFHLFSDAKVFNINDKVIIKLNVVNIFFNSGQILLFNHLDLIYDGSPFDQINLKYERIFGVREFIFIEILFSLYKMLNIL